MAYTKITNQPRRLGEFSLQLGELGQSGGAEYINAIGNAVQGVVQSLGATKVATTQSRTQRAVSITEATESTKKLGIQTQGLTQQASIAADQAKSKYRTIPVVILVSGVSLIGMIGISAWAYNKMVGEYEIEYE